MAHVALYRKYRSQDFGELSGQDHVSLTLRNALRLERIAQAYLFCGPRGTGKTSSARIFAKALNCVGPDPAHPLRVPPEQPCNQCRLCAGITDGTCLDVNEIDAASHTGVDNIREAIIAKADFAPVEGRRKVYIIDEVHKLSDAAFNSLLKTLEEPPPHLVFILATTDPHDLPATIVSRCQRFDFRRISQRDIVQRLDFVCAQEGYVAEPTALATVAEAADGSLRDALVVLEQAAAFAEGHITSESVGVLLGITDREALFCFAGLLLARDVQGALNLMDTLVTDGKDLVQLARDLVGHVRALLIARIARDAARILKVGDETLARLQQQAQPVSAGELMRMARVLMDLEVELRDPAHARLNWEVALIRLTAPELEASAAGTSSAAGSGRVPVPAGTAGGPSAPVGFPSPPPPVAAPPAAPPPPPPPVAARPAAPAAAPPPVSADLSTAPAMDPSPPAPSARPIGSALSPDAPLTLAVFREAFQQLLAVLMRENRVVLRSMLAVARPIRVDGDVCVLGVDARNNFQLERLERQRPEVAERLHQLLGRRVQVEVEPLAEGGGPPVSTPPAAPPDPSDHERFVQQGLDLFKGTIL